MRGDLSAHCRVCRRRLKTDGGLGRLKRTLADHAQLFCSKVEGKCSDNASVSTSVSNDDKEELLTVRWNPNNAKSEKILAKGRRTLKEHTYEAEKAVGGFDSVEFVNEETPKAFWLTQGHVNWIAARLRKNSTRPLLPYLSYPGETDEPTDLGFSKELTQTAETGLN